MHPHDPYQQQPQYPPPPPPQVVYVERPKRDGATVTTLKGMFWLVMGPIIALLLCCVAAVVWTGVKSVVDAPVDTPSVSATP